MFSCSPFIMAKTDGQLISPQAEEELLGDEEDPKRTDSTTVDQDLIYSIIETLRVNVSKNQRLSKKSRTRSKIDLAQFLPVGSLI